MSEIETPNLDRHGRNNCLYDSFTQLLQGQENSQLQSYVAIAFGSVGRDESNASHFIENLTPHQHANLLRAFVVFMHEQHATKSAYASYIETALSGINSDTTYEAYLEKHANNEMGTEVQASILAETYGVNLRINKYGDGTSFMQCNPLQTSNCAKTITINNHNNTHWTAGIDEDSNQEVAKLDSNKSHKTKNTNSRNANPSQTHNGKKWELFDKGQRENTAPTTSIQSTTQAPTSKDPNKPRKSVNHSEISRKLPFSNKDYIQQFTNFISNMTAGQKTDENLQYAIQLQKQEIKSYLAAKNKTSLTSKSKANNGSCATEVKDETDSTQFQMPMLKA